MNAQLSPCSSNARKFKVLPASTCIVHASLYINLLLEPIRHVGGPQSLQGRPSYLVSLFLI